MVRYGLGLLELKAEGFNASEERQPNYYDILISFLLRELELILQKDYTQATQLMKIILLAYEEKSYLKNRFRITTTEEIKSFAVSLN